MSSTRQRCGRDAGRSHRWFVVHTKPYREGRAAINLAQQGFQTFLPRFLKTVRHARRFRTATTPLFPRYLFVKLDLDRDRWRSVNSTFGVSGLIMEGDFPKPVRSEVVGELIDAADSSGVVSMSSTLRAGERARLATGPFAGKVGELVKLDDGDRAAVLLDILGTRTVVRTSRADLEPAA
ncbi:MAG: transcriptional activator RfaH [Hyphomicrobiales bacterium]|nr:transcriptional activator RfaH [Hyphomicrobiales bacterium]